MRRHLFPRGTPIFPHLFGPSFPKLKPPGEPRIHAAVPAGKPSLARHPNSKNPPAAVVPNGRVACPTVPMHV